MEVLKPLSVKTCRHLSQSVESDSLLGHTILQHPEEIDVHNY